MGLDNPWHIALLVVVVLLVFGARRLPEIGRQLGSGMREFKQSVTGQGGSDQAALTPGPPAQSTVTQASAPAAEPTPVATPVATPASAEPGQQA
jgi:sec-independent protein translocase protein TatA